MREATVVPSTTGDGAATFRGPHAINRDRRAQGAQEP
jgi:hypothetical protein